MAKGFTFGEVKQQSEKEQKSDDSGVVVTDVLNDYLDEKEQQMIDVAHKIKELEYQLEVKNQKLEAALETIAQLRREKEESNTSLDKSIILSQELATECEEKEDTINTLQENNYQLGHQLEQKRKDSETYKKVKFDFIKISEANLELEVRVKELEDELFTKNISIQGYNETIELLNIKLVELTEKVYELEEQTQEEKVIIVKPLKAPIDDEVIAQMRDYAKSILYKKGTIKFYEVVGTKFGVAAGSAYKYTKDIYQGNSNK